MNPQQTEIAQLTTRLWSQPIIWRGQFTDNKKALDESTKILNRITQLKREQAKPWPSRIDRAERPLDRGAAWAMLRALERASALQGSRAELKPSRA